MLVLALVLAPITGLGTAGCSKADDETVGAEEAGDRSPSEESSEGKAVALTTDNDGRDLVRLPDNTAYTITAGTAHGPPGSIIWTLHDQLEFRGSATIDKHGFVYVGNESGRLYKLDPATGDPKWVYNCCQDQPTPEFDERRGGQLCNVDSTPAIDLDGNLWVGCWNGTLAKLNPDGEVLCRAFAQDEFSSSPAVDLDGTIYMGSEDRVLWAIDGGDCSLKWKHDFPDGAVYGAPAVTAHGTIVTTSADDHVYAWDRDGKELWQFSTGFDIYSSVAVGGDGTLYVGSGDHNLYALTPNGREKWRYTARDRIDTSAVVGIDGTVYTASWDGNVYALSSDGSLRWVFDTGDEVWSSPALGSDGTVFIGSNDNHLYALGQDGTLLWKTELDGDIFASATVADNGTVYIGTHGGTFYAIRSASKGLADAPWPQFKGGRWRRAHACGSVAENCPCSSRPKCDGGDPCALELCNNKDDNCDGRVDEDACTPTCTDSTCQDGASYRARCSDDGTCRRTCYQGFTGADCMTPVATATGTAGSIAWVKSTGDGIEAPATVAEDGTIYVGSGDYYLYHLDANGKQLCRYRTEYHVDGPATVLSNGQIWFGSNDQVLHGIDSNCRPLCSQDDAVPVTGGSITGAVLGQDDGTILLTSGDGSLHRADPALCWAEPLLSVGGTIYGGPAAGNGALVFVASYGGTLIAWNSKTREVQWSVEGVGSVRAAVAVTSDRKRLYLASRDHRLLAIRTRDGKQLWERQLSDALWATPTLGSDGRIYVGSYDGTVHALNADGEVLWQYQTGGKIVSSIALVEGTEKTLYVGSGDGSLYALSQAGTLRWSTSTGSGIGASSPALTADGLVLVGNQEGHLVAVRRR